jgi:hypothetical protein
MARWKDSTRIVVKDMRCEDDRFNWPRVRFNGVTL